MMAQQASPSTASDLMEAVAIAERNFGQANASVDDYRLVLAQRLMAGGEHCSGTRCWRLTFKLARLIPDLLTYPAGELSGSQLCPATDPDHFDHLRL